MTDEKSQFIVFVVFTLQTSSPTRQLHGKEGCIYGACFEETVDVCFLLPALRHEYMTWISTGCYQVTCLNILASNICLRAWYYDLELL